jgi:hypothetical protein
MKAFGMFKKKRTGTLGQQSARVDLSLRKDWKPAQSSN